MVRRDLAQASGVTLEISLLVIVGQVREHIAQAGKWTDPTAAAVLNDGVDDRTVFSRFGVASGVRAKGISVFLSGGRWEGEEPEQK